MKVGRGRGRRREEGRTGRKAGSGGSPEAGRGEVVDQGWPAAGSKSQTCAVLRSEWAFFFLKFSLLVGLKSWGEDRGL